tara:strand:+ start:299 stop:997 length:699 start_codon:yes stop_codon:yes gene_type:complete
VNVENNMAKEFLDFHYSLNRLKLTVGHCLLVHVFYIILIRLAGASIQRSAVPVEGIRHGPIVGFCGGNPPAPFTKGGYKKTEVCWLVFRYDSNLKQVARGLRNGMTRSEQLLWSRLRGRQIQGIQFYRQNPIGVYIVDFYAPKAKLVVEVDGRQHLELDYRENDASRDAYLAGAGLSVLRFSNTQVSQELATVVTIIAKTLLDRINPAQLLISGNTYQPTHFLTDNPTSPLS